MGFKRSRPLIVDPVKRIAPMSADPGVYASFSDDTKTDGRLSDGYRASITAQVLPHERIDWFYELQPYFFVETGEVKSEVIVERLRSLPTDTQRRVRAGLAEVRIHIFDARPFSLEISDIHRDVFGARLPFRMLRHLEHGGDERQRSAARQLLSLANSYVLDRVTGSFVAKRLSEQLDPGTRRGWSEALMTGLGGISHHRSRRPAEAASRPHFDTPVRAGDVDRALAEGAKSAAVLADAANYVDQTVDYIGGSMEPFATSSTRMSVARTLANAHVFDEGDSKALHAVEDQRKQVLRAVWPGSDAKWVPDQARVAEMSSTSSVFLQAADIAAGFARHDYETYGLAGLVRRFRTVTFNGERANENNLKQVMGRMRLYLVE
jgi:hypothetical protein